MKHIKKLIKFFSIQLYDLIFWRLKNILFKPSCSLCFSKKTKLVNAYKRQFCVCEECKFIYANDFPEFIVNVGMGMNGSWGGVNAGGEREYYLTKYIQRNFDKESFLLYGVGSARGFIELLKEKFNVSGADLSSPVIEHFNNIYENRYFHVDKIKGKFDVIIATEVFEHFTNGRYYFNLINNHLNSDGIICGTTNFYPGSGSIEDNQKLGYMSIREHLCYWSEASLSYICNQYNYHLVTFEMIRPGSVLPDTKYNEIYENKRIFFISRDKRIIKKLEAAKISNPIIDLDTEKIHYDEL